MDGFTVIFTDLDGTLLDHNNYSFAPATPCLDYIHKTNIPLIFTSSKTAVEIESLCAQTSLYHPYIAENGGLLSIPKNYFSTNTSSRKKYEKKLIGKSRKSINLILQNLCEIYKFKSFNDMAISEIISLIGLEKNQALYANQRDCTEQIVWLDNNDKLKTFSEELEKYDLQLLSGAGSIMLWESIIKSQQWNYYYMTIKNILIKKQYLPLNLLRPHCFRIDFIP